MAGQSDIGQHDFKYRSPCVDLSAAFLKTETAGFVEWSKNIAYNKHSYYMLIMESESLTFLLSDCARLLRRRFDEQARTIGISRAQWQVLFALSRHEGINQSGLADYLEVETITLCRMIDRLQEAGHVERRADPADRRAWRLFLSPAAHPLLDRLRDVGLAVVDQAQAGMVDAVRDQVIDGLMLLRANLSRKPQEPERK
jgi:DNA-binding MarR family transcriptional regulator